MKIDGFQSGVLSTTSFLPELAAALRGLELVWPPLERVELCAEPSSDSLLVLLDFGDGDNALQQVPRLRALCSQVNGRLLQTIELPACRAQHTLRSRGRVVADAFAAMWARLPSPTRISFSSEAELLAAWAKQVAEGGMELEKATASVTFVTPTGEYAGNHTTRLPNGRFEVAAGIELTKLLHRVVNERRGVKRQPERPVPQSETEFALRIERSRELAARYENELRHGWLRLPVTDFDAVTARVVVRLTLPSEEVVVLNGELLERHGDDTVTLKLESLGDDIFEPVKRLLELERARRPRVLVIDDEAIWRSTLVRMLKELNADVVLASDGRDGLVKLIDAYFELDLVILDLHMPELDGRTVLDRIRRLGGDSAMRVLLFSATSREELADIDASGAASAVFSKIDPLDRLRDHVIRELGLEATR